ncbi:MAG: phosphatidylinositol mannoside acyltransferase, partial [Actinobacteria bacterium]|nr:phosphatidylinositol mannoside acyltransferase [Actinomycetota bacterium]
MSRLAERATLVGYRAGWSLVRRMPGRLAYGSFDLIGDVVWRRGGKGVERMRSNYATVRPEL